MPENEVEAPAVAEAQPEKFDFVCEVPRCGFVSYGWTTKEQADARAEQHKNEHDTGEPMVELIEFEAQVGFIRGDAVPDRNAVMSVDDGQGNITETEV